MADNSLQTAADTIRDKDRAGVKTQIFGLDLGIGGAESLMNGSMPMRLVGLTLATGTITTSASTVTATTDVASCGAVTVVIAGTYAGVNATFEASLEGTTWVAIMGQRVDSYVTETTTGVLAANTTRAWDFPIPGFTQFRVRATAYTSGTANVGIAPTVAAFETNPTVGIAGAATSTLTGVAASASSGVLLAANSLRRGATIVNDSTSATLYVRLGAAAAAATSGNYTVALLAGDYYEVPASYTGEIRGIWSAATGYANVTEVVT